VLKKRSAKYPNAEDGATGSRRMASAPFPETRHSLLAAAAAGSWEDFLAEYLQPCWRELGFVCRRWGFDATDAEDLLQDLMLRMIRTASFRKELAEAMPSDVAQIDLTGNLPARYLIYTRTVGKSARFRTYLKAVILNVVREAVRQRSKRPLALSEPLQSQFEPAVEAAVDQALDAQWFRECLVSAARQLRVESTHARTKARRRMFDVLYHTLVERTRQTALAEKLGVDRSTLSGILKLSRERFVALVQRLAGLASVKAAETMIARNEVDVRSALIASGNDATARG
jgi:DNA-directed RNA polymerase specialized sigma24 family protein